MRQGSCRGMGCGMRVPWLRRFDCIGNHYMYAYVCVCVCVCVCWLDCSMFWTTGFYWLAWDQSCGITCSGNGNHKCSVLMNVISISYVLLCAWCSLAKNLSGEDMEVLIQSAMSEIGISNVWFVNCICPEICYGSAFCWILHVCDSLYVHISLTDRLSRVYVHKYWREKRK
jgi:hypothetical protein